MSLRFSRKAHRFAIVVDTDEQGSTADIREARHGFDNDVFDVRVAKRACGG